MFNSKLKEILNKIPNKTNFLRDLGLPGTYLGIRYFLTGKQEKIGDKGLNAILQKMDYELIMVPVKKDSPDKEILLQFQDKFFTDLEDYLTKFENDTRRERVKYSEENNVIEDKLKELDTSDLKPVSSDGVEIDLGITDANDLF